MTQESKNIAPVQDIIAIVVAPIESFWSLSGGRSGWCRSGRVGIYGDECDVTRPGIDGRRGANLDRAERREGNSGKGYGNQRFECADRKERSSRTRQVPLSLVCVRYLLE